MKAPPNAAANTEDFEFAALEAAKNYRCALVEEFRGALRGTVLEVGAGIGQMTRHLLQHAGELISIEPDPGFCERHRSVFPGHQLVEGTVEDLPANAQADAIVSINVLEHIEQDEAELARYARLLQKRAGSLCLLVPARPEIYAPIDRDFGHFRRYTKPELAAKLQRAGFVAQTLCYYNMPGYLAWWLNFSLLGERHFQLSKVRLYDGWIFPAVHWLESRVCRPPLGQSLLCIARPGAAQ